jgi:class 3 adenylate cyclase/CheY-like chemotaxis protein
MPNVFLLEPDPSLREWCRLHLSTDGVSVVSFDDGRRALEALRVEPPDLVMIATNLVGMSAFALAAAIRSNVRSALTPILFLVPGKDTAALSQALAIEPQGVVSKPLSRELLLESVHVRLGNPFGANVTGQQSRRPEPGPRNTSVRGTASGPLLETKQATVLVVAVRNFVSLARALNASVLDRFMSEFAAHVREAIFTNGGWIVRADAMSMVALFEDVPDQANPHCARALEAALGAVLSSRSAKRWGEAALANRASLDVSVGCGVHTGEVIVARLTVGGHLAPCIAGQTPDLAQRLEGRAKGLHWSIACSEAVVLQAGTRFEAGHRSSLTDTDHDVTIPIVEIRGYAPGAARPGELARMGEVREAMLANTLLSSLAGDVDQQTAERTILVRGPRPAAETMPAIPGRNLERRAKHSSSADAYLATHVQSGRKELVEVIPLTTASSAFVETYLNEYRKLQKIEQRNIASVYEVGHANEVMFVALEYVSGGSLADALRRSLTIGVALNCLAQACIALDTLHQAGIVHANLRLEHFSFRTDGALVLTDFNVTSRVGALLGVQGRATARRSAPLPIAAAARADFLALGKMLHALLTGDRMLLGAKFVTANDNELERASRLPVQLSPIQSCLDGLLGVGNQAPVDQAQDVLIALMAVRDIFPFDLRPVPMRGGGRAG